MSDTVVRPEYSSAEGPPIEPGHQQCGGGWPAFLGGPDHPHTGCRAHVGPHHMVPGGRGKNFQNLVFGLSRASGYGLGAQDHVGCDPHVPRMEQFQYEPNPL